VIPRKDVLFLAPVVAAPDFGDQIPPKPLFWGR